MAQVKVRRSSVLIDPAGTERFGHLPPRLNPTLQKLWQPGTPFAIDPAAESAYRDIVASLRAHHVQIVFLVPPIFEGLLETKRAAHRDYLQHFADCRQPGDLVLDFGAAEFQDFRSHRENFADGVHLLNDRADQVVALLSRQIDVWQAQGRLTAGRPRGTDVN